METKAKTPTPKSSTLKQSDKKTNSLKKKDTVSSEPEILYNCNFKKDDLMWYNYIITICYIIYITFNEGSMLFMIMI